MENNLKKILGFFENQLDNPFLGTIVAVIIIAIIIFIVIQIRKAKKSWSRPASTGPKKPSLLSRIWEPIDLWLTLKIERIKFTIEERHRKKMTKKLSVEKRRKVYPRHIVATLFFAVTILVGIFFSEKLVFVPLLASVIYFMTGAIIHKLPPLPSDFYDDNIDETRKAEMMLELEERSREGLKLREIESFLINFSFFFLESILLFNWEITRFDFFNEEVILGQSLGILFVVLHVVYTICSFKLINPPGTQENNRGVIKRFGNRFTVVENSLQNVPFLIYSLERQSTLEVVEYFPAEERNLDFVSQDNPGEGKKAPWRILTGGDRNSKDPFGVPMNQEVYGSYAYAITEPLWFALKVGSREEAKQQIEQTTRQRLEVSYIKKSPKEVRESHSEIVDDVVGSVERLVADWGIKFNDKKFVVKLPDPGYTISKSLRDKADALIQKDTEIINAQKDKEAMIERSLGVKTKQINEGDGAAHAEKAMRIAKAEALKKLMAVVKDNDKALALIAVEKVTESILKSDKLILGSNGIIDAAAIFEKAKNWIDSQEKTKV